MPKHTKAKQRINRQRALDPNSVLRESELAEEPRKGKKKKRALDPGSVVREGD